MGPVFQKGLYRPDHLAFIEQLLAGIRRIRERLRLAKDEERGRLLMALEIKQQELGRFGVRPAVRRARPLPQHSREPGRVARARAARNGKAHDWT